MKISEIITDKYKLRMPPTVYYELLADVVEAEEEQEPSEDAVSRQDVIDIIESQQYLDGNDAIVWIEKYIRELPSVTPTITTDIITEYCKEHNYVLCEKGTERKILDDIKTEIKQLPMYATRFEDCVAIHINKNDVLGIIEKHIRKEKDND